MDKASKSLGFLIDQNAHVVHSVASQPSAAGGDDEHEADHTEAGDDDGQRHPPPWHWDEKG